LWRSDAKLGLTGSIATGKSTVLDASTNISHVFLRRGGAQALRTRPSARSSGTPELPLTESRSISSEVLADPKSWRAEALGIRWWREIADSSMRRAVVAAAVVDVPLLFGNGSTMG
jgi:hypothetical protein